jgi:twinkle protein
MIDWERGLATCQHCGDVLQLHTYKKQESKKIYVRPEWKNNTGLSNKLLKWFADRGISPLTLQALKITEGVEWMPNANKEINTVQFNYFRNAELINVKYRDGAKNFKMFKDAEKIFYNIDMINYSKDAVIVEGEIDVMSFIEAGIYHVISVPNGSTTGNVNLDYLDNCIDYFNNKETIYLCLDKDDPGQNVQKELIRRFGSERCKIIDLKECKDANDYLVKYGKESLRQQYDTAELIPLDGVSSVLDFKESFEDYLINGFRSGYKIGKPFFDKQFTTYTGQFIVVTGKPSSGKSDFVDEMCMGYSFNYGWKTAYASLENKPNSIHCGKLISKLCGKWINRPELMGTPQYNAALDYMDDHFKFIDLDKYDLELVLEKAKAMIYRYGIKVLVLDPYNKIRLTKSINKTMTEYANDYLCMIDEFCRKHDCLVILVPHPRKPGPGESKDYVPDFYSIKGGGEFYDMSPHGLLVHKIKGSVMIKVLKVKFSHLGNNEAEIFMRWDKYSGRYHELTQQENIDETTSIINTWIDNRFEEAAIRLNPTREEIELEKEQMEWNQEIIIPF